MTEYCVKWIEHVPDKKPSHRTCILDAESQDDAIDRVVKRLREGPHSIAKKLKVAWLAVYPTMVDA